MNRFKLFAMATLLAVPVVNACDDEMVTPATTGSISGKVAIGDQGIDGITVSLSSGMTTATSGGGAYRFNHLKEGTYEVTISNYPEDATFDATSESAKLEKADDAVTVDFAGSWIRTSGIMGTVKVGDDGLNGVSVKISGVSESDTVTGTDGRYAFDELRAGNYTIEISGFDAEDVAFDSTSFATEVAVGESKVVDFQGMSLRTAAIMGKVTVDGTGLKDVMVSLSGEGEDLSVETNESGEFAFDELRKGSYTIEISGFDTADVAFDSTSFATEVAVGESKVVDFQGMSLRTAAIMGKVTVDGAGLKDVMVSLSGEGEDLSVETNESGEFAFDELRKGSYTVTITNPDANMYNFPTTSQAVSLVVGQTLDDVLFAGEMLGQGS